MSTELVTNDEGERLKKALQRLDQRDLEAYKYFLKKKYDQISEETADKLYQLFLQSKSCEEIRRAHGSFSLGHIVAARIRYQWDEKRDAYRAHIEKAVPARARQVHIETVDFLADMLSATEILVRERLAQYALTKDENLLKDLPLPKTPKEFREMVDLFIKATGNDKKRVEVSGRVTVDNSTGVATAISSEDAADIAAQLLTAVEQKK